MTLVFVPAASAQEETSLLSDLLGEDASAAPQAGPACSGGLILDDGSFENGLRIAFASDARMVQKFTPASYPALVNRVCTCWKTGLNGGSIGFSFVFYDDNGVGGQPGTFLGSAPASVSIPTALGEGFVGIDCAEAGVVVSEGSFYAGVQWNASSNVSFFACTDQSPSTPARENYKSANGGFSWVPLRQDVPETRALGVRAELLAGNCAPSATAMCLNDNRFKVEATFETRSGQTGQAKVVKLTEDTGYLWFFDSSNVEAVVKVLDACPINDRFWVFAGGLTDVRVDLRVTDTKEELLRTYANPLGVPFAPVQDTSAFATCP